MTKKNIYFYIISLVFLLSIMQRVKMIIMNPPTDTVSLIAHVSILIYGIGGIVALLFFELPGLICMSIGCVLRLFIIRSIPLTPWIIMTLTVIFLFVIRGKKS